MSYRDEEIAMLQAEIAKLKQERDQLPVHESPRWTMPKIEIQKVVQWSAYFFCVALAFTAVFAIWNAIMASDRIEYCYPAYSFNRLELMGYRRWDSDVTLSTHDTVTNAAKAAEQMHCPFVSIGK